MKKIITGCCLLFSFAAIAENFNGETILPQKIVTSKEVLVEVPENYEQDPVSFDIVNSILDQDREAVIVEKRL